MHGVAGALGDDASHQRAAEEGEVSEAVAEALLKYETLQRDDVDRLMRGESIGKPTVADLLSGEAARSKPVIDGKSAEDPGTEPGLGGAMPSPA